MDRRTGRHGSRAAHGPRGTRRDRTVRMSPDQMAQVHGTLGVPSGPPAMTPPPPAPTPAPPAPPPMPPIMSPIATTPTPMQHLPETRAPEFGHFTDPGAAPRPGAMPLQVSSPARPYGAPTPVVQGGIPVAPAPQSAGLLGKFLPPIPDDAQPTGERGDFFTRLIAAIIDSLVIIPVMIVMFIFSFVVGILANRVPALGMIAGCLGMVIYIVAVFGYFLYFIPKCVSKHGATIGKKMMKLRIVPEDDPMAA